MVTVTFTALPFKLTCVADKLQVVLAGAPLQVRATVPVDPVIALTVSVAVPECPRATVRLAGESETEKSFTFCVNAADELPRKLPLPELNVATTEWLPPDSPLVENCAVPPESVEVCAGVVLPSR